MEVFRLGVGLVLQNDFRWGGGGHRWPLPQIFLGEVTVTPSDFFFFWGGGVTGDHAQIKVTAPQIAEIFSLASLATRLQKFFRSRGGPRHLHFVLYIFATRYDWSRSNDNF